MFDDLKKYKQNDHFLFKLTDNLREVCNAPTDKSGIYIIYSLKDGQKQLIYIGRSGQVKRDGSLFIRKAGVGGLKDRLVNGKQFGNPRRLSWKHRMNDEKIEALDIYWYVTHNELFVDCPKELEKKLLRQYLALNGCLPKWNNEF